MTQGPVSHHRQPKGQWSNKIIAHATTEEDPVNADKGREGGEREEFPYPQELFVSEGWKAWF